MQLNTMQSIESSFLLMKPAIIRLLSPLLYGRPKTTKKKIEGLFATAMGYVIADGKIDRLMAGSLYLDNEFHPAFSKGKLKIGGDIIAAVAIGELEIAEIFKGIAATRILDTTILQLMTDQLIDYAFEEFEKQCPAFAALPS